MSRREWVETLARLAAGVAAGCLVAAYQEHRERRAHETFMEAGNCALLALEAGSREDAERCFTDRGLRPWVNEKLE